jgi:hypothetical protein
MTSSQLLLASVDAAIALTLLELLVVTLRTRARAGGGIATLLSGLALMLALRAALVDAGTAAVLTALGAAGAAHVLDLVVRGWPPRTSRGRTLEVPPR